MSVQKPAATERGKIEFSPPSAAEIQARHLEALEICADWKESIQRRKARLLLRRELIGGVDEDEVQQLKEDADRLKRCMAVLAWRGPSDDS